MYKNINDVIIHLDTLKQINCVIKDFQKQKYFIIPDLLYRYNKDFSFYTLDEGCRIFRVTGCVGFVSAESKILSCNLNDYPTFFHELGHVFMKNSECDLEVGSLVREQTAEGISKYMMDKLHLPYTYIDYKKYF